MASKSKEMVKKEKEIRQVFYDVMRDKFDIDVARDSVRIKEEDIFLKTGLTDLDLIVIVEEMTDRLYDLHGKEVIITDYEMFTEIKSSYIFFDVINFVVAKCYSQIYVIK